MKKVLSSILFLLILCSVAIEAGAQKQARSDEIIATTADGRKVILKSDGTWEYFKEPEPVKEQPPQTVIPAPVQSVPPAKDVQEPAITPEAPKPPVTAEVPPAAVTKETPRGTLSFDAGINNQPITGSTFYLLDEDLSHILQGSNFKSEKGMSLLNTFSMANYGATIGVERSSKSLAKAMEFIKPHIVATTTSDSNGKGEFFSVVSGTYYLMNISVIFLNTGSLSDRKSVLWNVRVQMHSGQNIVSLSESNALL